jgi:hypothetical protein
MLSFFLSTAVMAAETVEVWKSPSCGCCTAWVQHLKAAGFPVRAHEVQDVDEARSKNGVPQSLGACHTARVGGYAIEGHVPASAIKRLLAERPLAAGLAVPGMPPGSPGMETPRGESYESLLFTSDGRTRVWQRYQPNDHGR